MPEDTAPTDATYLKHFDWIETNRTEGFKDWHAEVTHAESQGYSLVPPDYVIPHWSVQIIMNNALPKIYVMRMNNEFVELRSCFDRRAGQIGYPLFYRKHSTN